jgi:hypothetical protein
VVPQEQVDPDTASDTGAFDIHSRRCGRSSRIERDRVRGGQSRLTCGHACLAGRRATHPQSRRFAIHDLSVRTRRLLAVIGNLLGRVNQTPGFNFI